MEIGEIFKNRIYALLRERNFEKAEELLEREIEEDPENFKNYELLGDLYLEKEDEDRALENYEKAIRVARDKAQEINILPLFYKIKKIKGETPDVNIWLARFFKNYGLKRYFKNTFLNYFKGLVNSKNKEEGIRFIKGVFEGSLENEFLFYFLSHFGEGEEYLKRALTEYREKGKTEIVHELEGFLGGGGIDVERLKEIIKIEGIEERKLDPQGTLELAELLDGIGSKEEALNEYLSSIYGFIAERNDIEKAKEIIEKAKNLALQDERIKEVEEFLKNPPVKGRRIEVSKVDSLLEKRIEEIVEENDENLKRVGRVFSISRLHDEAVKMFEELLSKGLKIDDEIEYYLYSLYEAGEYEKIIEMDKKIEGKEDYLKFFKALSYEKLGEKNTALELLNEIYERNPDFMDIEERIRTIRGEKVFEKVGERISIEEIEILSEHEEIVEKPLEKQEVKGEVVEKKEKKGLNQRIFIVY